MVEQFLIINSLSVVFRSWSSSFLDSCVGALWCWVSRCPQMPSFMFIDAPLFRGPDSSEGQTIINPDFVTVIFLGDSLAKWVHGYMIYLKADS